MGLEFEVAPPNVDERAVECATPLRMVRELSKLKAEAIDTDAMVIAADTTVVLEGKIYGKPLCYERAAQMLKELSGRWHTVYTGVTVRYGDSSESFTVRSRVKMKNLSEDFIKTYLKECAPYDKAGAYGIQDSRVVERYRGSYSNIMGLPKEKLMRVLKRHGVTNGND